MTAIWKHLSAKTITTLRWTAVLPAAIGSMFLLLFPISPFYSNPFCYDLPPAVITYGRTALLVCVALTVAAITAPSRKRFTFWVVFAFWTVFNIARSVFFSSDSSTLSFPQPNPLIRWMTCAVCALLVFLFLHRKNFRIVPKKWPARVGIILGLYALAAFLHLYPTLHVLKLRHITRHHPEIIQIQILRSAVNDFGYSKVTPIQSLPDDLLSLQNQAISEAHRLHGAAGMTPYFFKISNKYGVCYCLLAYKQTSQFSSYAQFWLSKEHGINQSGRGRWGSPDHSDGLPERVADSLAEFHLFYASDCTQLDSFPDQLLEWHPNLPELIDKYVQPNHADAFYFENEQKNYLLAWDKKNQSSCLWITRAEVLTLDPDKFDAFISVSDSD
jgi:hypothetical protein